MADIARGINFGATEQVTAAKLHALVDDATVSSIVAADITDGVITNAKISDVAGSKFTGLANIPAGSGVIPVANTNACLLSGTQTVAGVKTFSSFSLTPSSAPTTDYQVANKKYVDDTKPALGIWVDKTASYGAQQAATDGFVCAFTAYGVQGFTDGNADPTTLRVFSQGGTYNSITFPVKKNDYWKVIAVSGSLNAVYWIPLGN